LRFHGDVLLCRTRISSNLTGSPAKAAQRKGGDVAGGERRKVLRPDINLPEFRVKVQVITCTSALPHRLAGESQAVGRRALSPKHRSH
jgi:hypothetical protein